MATVPSLADIVRAGGSAFAGGGLTPLTVSSANVAPAASNTFYMMATGGTLREVTLPASCPATFTLGVCADGAQVRIISNGNIIDEVGSGNDLLLEDGQSVVLNGVTTGNLEVVQAYVPGGGGAPGAGLTHPQVLARTLGC